MRDVEDFFAEHDPYADLETALEKATHRYAVACDEAAEAENSYLREYGRALLSLRDEPVTIRHNMANAMAVEDKAVWNIKAAAEKSARQKCDELKTRAMMRMSHQRVVSGQT